MQFLGLTMYIRGGWVGLRPGQGADAVRREEHLAADLTASLLALDPAAAPAPRVLRIEFPKSFPSYLYDEAKRPHFEDFMDSCYALVLLPMTSDLLGLEERLRPYLAERFLHISERWTVAGEMARSG